MPRIKLTLEYDGTAFVGWQEQRNGRSVQSVLEQGLEKLLGQPTRTQAAGRTDSGVHALGQVAAFTTAMELPMKAYSMGLNGHLPQDLAVVFAEVAPDDFDPRRWAEGKRYRYLVSNRKTRSPLRRLTHWEVFAPLDVKAMQEASRALVGRHDFSAFRAADCQAPHAMREIKSLTVEATEGEVIQIDVRGTAFLKHMVRNIAGSLAEVGKGKQPPSWVAEVLKGRDRTLAGPTAPAHGLCLVEVTMGTGPHAPAPGDEAADDE